MNTTMPTSFIDTELYKAFVNWFPLRLLKHPYFVTLTLKEGLPLDRGGWLRWDRDRVVRNLDYFNNFLDRAVLGSASKYRCLPRAFWLENTVDKRPHVHGIIDCVRDDKLPLFPDLVTLSWRRTWWGRHQVDVQPATDFGAVTYCAKRRDKADYADSFLWETWSPPNDQSGT